MTPEALAQRIKELEQGGMTRPQAIEFVRNEANNSQTVDQAVEILAAEEQVLADEEAAAGAAEAGDQNGDGQVDPQEGQIENQEQVARAALNDEDPSNDAEAATILTQALGGAIPPEVLEYFGNQPPSPSQIQDAVRAYNALNPSRPLQAATDLWNRWLAGDATAINAVEAVAPARPTDWVEIKVGQQSLNVRGSHYQSLFQNYGDGFVRNQSVVYGAVRDSNRMIPASAIAGALAVSGALQPNRESNPKFEQDAQASTDNFVVLNAYELLKQRGDLPARAPQFRDNMPEAERARRIREALGQSPEFQAALEEVRGNDAAMAGFERAGRRRSDPTGKTPQQRGMDTSVVQRDRYERYYQRFQNHGLALVAMRNDKLAQQIRENPQEALRSSRVRTMVQQIFLDAGYSQEQWNAQGDAFDGDLWNNLLGGQGGGGGANVEVVNLPDDAAVEESMRNLWRSWFRRDPSAEELAGFTGHIDNLFTSEAQRVSAAAGGGGAGNPFEPDTGGPGSRIVTSRNVDAGAELLQRARASAEYRRMFGRKPEYLDEEEYIQRFESSAQQFAGNTIPTEDAIGAGMQSGDTNTTVGKLLHDPNVFDNSSTFRDRMFRAAQAFNRALG